MYTNKLAAQVPLQRETAVEHELTREVASPPLSLKNGQWLLNANHDKRCKAAPTKSGRSLPQIIEDRRETVNPPASGNPVRLLEPPDTFYNQPATVSSCHSPVGVSCEAEQINGVGDITDVEKIKKSLDIY